MITEVCGAEHCGSASVLSPPGENGMGQVQRSKGVARHYMENHISAQRDVVLYSTA